MKRVGNLLEQIIDRENLRLAFHKALRGKRSRGDARAFAECLEDHLCRMAEEVCCGKFPVGRYHQFTIYDPKLRVITAPCFAERVLHHAILNVCEPAFERFLIGDTYACRRGKGRIAALARARRFAFRQGFFLKMDICKYFPSVSQEILLAKLQRMFKDQRLLKLFARIIQGFEDSPGRGLPIGSLTSQHFANFYLGFFDHFVKETLRIKGYVRYMDDMVLWSDSAPTLRECLVQARAFLAEELELQLKLQPYINRTRHGMDFLGCRVFRTHLALNARSRRRFSHKLQALEIAVLAGHVGERERQERATSLVAFTRTPGIKSWHFRRAVLQR